MSELRREQVHITKVLPSRALDRLYGEGTTKFGDSFRLASRLRHARTFRERMVRKHQAFDRLDLI